MLHKIRILDLTRLLPGAYATQLLADLGAEVIKVEDPNGGDTMRQLRVAARPKPSRSNETIDADRARRLQPSVSFFERFNRGKRSVTLNLRSRDALPVLDALAATSDVLVESFRPSTARRLGVDGATLSARQPRLICASINGFGLTGPDAERAAHDINYQALAGLLVARGEPVMPGPLVADIGAAMRATIAILAALLERQRTGAGCVLDIPIHHAANEWAMLPSTADLESACYNLYETADGQWLALGALEPKFWRAFCDGIGRADLVALQHAAGDEQQRVVDQVRSVIRTHNRVEWLARFADVDACLTPVERSAQGLADERSGEAPALGADTDSVLGEIGIGEARRAELRAAGVI